MGACATSKHFASQLILGRYRMSEEPGAVLGEGSSSVCRRGTDTLTGDKVAIKVYKSCVGSRAGDRCNPAEHFTVLTKFKRQVAVLQELQKPMKPPADPSLWSEDLAKVESGDIFMRLLAYSTDRHGEPGRDFRDGNLYIVTELGQYDLKQYIKKYREKHETLSVDKVHSITKAILLTVAGLHAKGFTHLDIKPANLMMFDGRWKVIDVDGCVRVGESITLGDSTLSFSPCYCSPEWARFVTQDRIDTLAASPSLDAWSVGMTLCELVILGPHLKAKYETFVEGGESRMACLRFLSWLGRSKHTGVPLPGSIRRLDEGFHELLTKWLLIHDSSTRKSLAECLRCPYLAQAPAVTRE
jgi:serine/threonine protein kinase